MAKLAFGAGNAQIVRIVTKDDLQCDRFGLVSERGTGAMGIHVFDFGRGELAVLRSRARGDAVSATVRSTKPSPQECESLRSLGYTAMAEDVCSPL